MSLQSWLEHQISMLMGFDTPEFAQYLLTIQDKHELETAFFSFLGDGELTQQTWNEFIQKWESEKGKTSSSAQAGIGAPAALSNQSPLHSQNSAQNSSRADSGKEASDLSSLEQGVKPKKPVYMSPSSSAKQTSANNTYTRRRDNDTEDETAEYMQKLDLELEKDLENTRAIQSNSAFNTAVPEGAQKVNVPEHVPKSLRERYGTQSTQKENQQHATNSMMSQRSSYQTEEAVPKEKVRWGNLDSNIPVVELKPQRKTVRFSTSGKVYGKNANVAGNSVGHNENDTSLEESRGEYCPCMATIHNLMGNCLECGKLICEREAAQLCSFCGNTLPWRVSRKAITNARGRAAQLTRQYNEEIEHERKLLFREQIDDDDNEGVNEAIRRKNQLLHYDQTSAERSHVYDDQADYFRDSTSAWLSEEEKETAKAKEEQRRQNLHERRQNKMSLEISGGNVSIGDQTRENKVKDDASRFGISEEKASRGKGNTGDSCRQTVKGLVGKTSSTFRDYENRLDTGEEENDSQGAANTSDRPYANSTLAGRAAEIYSALQADAKRRQEKKSSLIAGLRTYTIQL
eukprot:gb/GECG01009617.1/.p1 GENE.gb/GECG01009617.1/~~gb/GECG01009617.1/.p1  ORF type:complete len:573 (+),score=103.80 gb/GECG01009617.1/:1-1719(+)